MRAKEYLEQARKLDDRIDTKIQYLEYLNCLATKCTSVMSHAPRGGNQQNGLDATVAKIIDLENEINADIDRLVDLKAEITKVINQVPDSTQRMLLEKRYLCRMMWEDIGCELHYGPTWTKKIHFEALESVEKILNAKE